MNQCIIPLLILAGSCSRTNSRIPQASNKSAKPHKPSSSEKTSFQNSTIEKDCFRKEKQFDTCEETAFDTFSPVNCDKKIDPEFSYNSPILRESCTPDPILPPDTDCSCSNTPSQLPDLNTGISRQRNNKIPHKAIETNRRPATPFEPIPRNCT